MNRTGKGAALGVATIVTMSVAGLGTAQAQCTTSAPNPFLGGVLNAVGGGTASTANSVLAAINTMDTAFLAQGSAFVTSPTSQKPDQPGGGVWTRQVLGQATTESTGKGAVTIGGVLSGQTNCGTSVRQEFGGVQAGFDIGRLNLGGTGQNIFFGLTAGYGRSAAHDNGAGFSGTFQVPFVGAYAAFTYDRFFADLMVRANFYRMELENPAISLHGQGLDAHGVSISGNAGYNIAIPNSNWFIEPSVGFVHSHVKVDTLNIQGNLNIAAPENTGLTPPGVIRFDDVKSTLGRLGVRLGTNVNVGNLALQPFVTASIWHEFQGDAVASFNSTAFGGTSVQQRSSRIGTYGQYSAGIAGLVAGTGWAGYARLDLREGSNIEGVGVNGGVRYSFDSNLSAESAMAAASGARRAPVTRAAATPVSTAFDWTGCYLGGQGGYGRGRSATNAISAGNLVADEEAGDFGSKPSGGIVGGQLGCNYAFPGNWVVGLEGEGWWSSMKATKALNGDFDGGMEIHSLQARNLWDVALSLRLGVAIDRTLFYVKGGGAYGSFQYTYIDGADFHDFNVNSAKFGWIIGGGVEYALTQYWTAKIEYNYLDFGNNHVHTFLSEANQGGTLVPSLPYSFTVKETKSIIKAGLNFKFGS